MCSMCAPVMVELEGETDPLQIAMKELKYMLSLFVCFYWMSAFIHVIGICSSVCLLFGQNTAKLVIRIVLVLF